MNKSNGRLKILPCLDSPEMSASRQKELDIPRNTAAQLGKSAVEAAITGHYVNKTGKKVDWSPYVQAACSAKLSIPPTATLPAHDSIPFSETRIQVTNETTLGASSRLVSINLKPLALNFANGIHPGGGFLNGARAQEEVLCRSSALYKTICDDEMYEKHRKRKQPDSTDWAILSPDVPVFRTDDGTELEHPWSLSFITCAAPYAPAIGQPEAGNLLQQRIHRVLAIARAYGYSALVLGAWGCGAFANDAWRTASDFRHALENEFSGAFSDIVFAITDWSAERKILGPFRDVFAMELKFNKQCLPYLDREVLDQIFENVYGEDLNAVKDDQLREFLRMLQAMQTYNYTYRDEMFRSLYPVVAKVIEMEINSEGTSLWLALCLAIKELYGMRNSTLQEVLRKLTVRK